jgi:rifampin ADP-ribosylating transferase
MIPFDGQEVPGQSDEVIPLPDPLGVTGEVTDWNSHSPEELRTMKDHIEPLKQLGVEAIED